MSGGGQERTRRAPSAPGPALARRRRRRALALLTAVAFVAFACGVLVVRADERDTHSPPVAPATRARLAADAFLRRYVEPDGRVVRRDQGGDTVSEGQSYGMLLAAALGDQRRFDRIWGWTRTNLARPDGLLSWNWKAGKVTDQQPATDADLDAARALALAATRFHRPALRRQAFRIAGAILGEETVPAPGGRVVSAGPWARAGGIVNPSYASPNAFAALGRLGDRRAWADVERASVRMLAALQAGGRLPPDWVRQPPTGPATATGAPGQQWAAPGFGYDAVRVPIRLAEACDPAARKLAAASGKPLGAAPADAPVRRLDGTLAGGDRHPVALVAGAAAAAAAGDRARALDMLDQAEALDGRQPTYYGSAWVALGRVMLSTRMLGSCGTATLSRSLDERRPPSK
jgi:endoglucanase